MPTELLLRPARPEDAAALTDLCLAARQAAYPAMPHGIHPPHEVRAWFGEVLHERLRTTPMPDERETWLAESDDAVVGYLVLDPEWLDSLFVRPDLTGEGIGSAMLDLVKSLRPDGFGLWVFETNVRAQAFYRRHGLHIVRRTDGSDNEEHAPDLEMAWFGRQPQAVVRRRIDDVDDRLAALLDERSRLTAAVQQFKAVPGHAGRDPGREAEIVARMAQVALFLGEERLARIMHVVISESLDAAEDAGPPTTPPAPPPAPPPD